MYSTCLSCYVAGKEWTPLSLISPFYCICYSIQFTIGHHFNITFLTLLLYRTISSSLHYIIISQQLLFDTCYSFSVSHSTQLPSHSLCNVKVPIPRFTVILNMTPPSSTSYKWASPPFLHILLKSSTYLIWEAAFLLPQTPTLWKACTCALFFYVFAKGSDLWFFSLLLII